MSDNLCNRSPITIVVELELSKYQVNWLLANGIETLFHCCGALYDVKTNEEIQNIFQLAIEKSLMKNNGVSDLTRNVLELRRLPNSS